jgi:hypothetical protein
MSPTQSQLCKLLKKNSRKKKLLLKKKNSSKYLIKRLKSKSIKNNKSNSLVGEENSCDVFDGEETPKSSNQNNDLSENDNKLFITSVQEYSHANDSNSLRSSLSSLNSSSKKKMLNKDENNKYDSKNNKDFNDNKNSIYISRVPNNIVFAIISNYLKEERKKYIKESENIKEFEKSCKEITNEKNSEIDSENTEKEKKINNIPEEKKTKGHLHRTGSVFDLKNRNSNESEEERRKINLMNSAISFDVQIAKDKFMKTQKSKKIIETRFSNYPFYPFLQNLRRDITKLIFTSQQIKSSNFDE